MSNVQSSLRCRTCQRPTLHAREQFSGGMGLLLTIITAGAFIPIWLVIGLFDAGRWWRCQVCGRQQRTAGAAMARSASAILAIGIIAGLAWGAWYVYATPELMREVREFTGIGNR